MRGDAKQKPNKCKEKTNFARILPLKRSILNLKSLTSLFNYVKINTKYISRKMILERS